MSSAVIADLDGDGVGELVVGGTDGSVDFLTWDLAGDVGAAAMAPLAAKGSWKVRQVRGRLVQMTPKGARTLSGRGLCFL